MKEESLNALSKLIRREVKAAIQEEVRDIIIEAVRIASTPKSTEHPTVKSVVTNELNNTSTNTARADIRAKFQAINPIEQMLQETKLSFTSADAKNFMSGGPMNPNKAVAVAHELGMMDAPQSNIGVDLSDLPFLKNAKTILDLSKEKDKLKYGGN